MGYLKRFGHWFISHSLFSILEKIAIFAWDKWREFLGGAIMLGSFTGWLLNLLQPFLAYIIFGTGFVVIGILLFLRCKPKRVVEPTVVHEKVRFLNILVPSDESSVPLHSIVAGTISDVNTCVWVIIHPKDSLRYYVHPRINGIEVANNGTWNTLVLLKDEESSHTSDNRNMTRLADVLKGAPVDGDIGKRFQIMAVANPKGNLGAVDRLTRWPRAEYESKIVEVVRE